MIKKWLYYKSINSKRDGFWDKLYYNYNYIKDFIKYDIKGTIQDWYYMFRYKIGSPVCVICYKKTGKTAVCDKC